MKYRNKIVAVVAVVLAVLGLAACSGNSVSSDQKRSAQTLRALDRSQPVPVFNYSQIRQTLIDAETAQADTTQTTTFFFNFGVADPVFVCPSIGFPVPGTDQITNPEQVEHHSSDGGGNITYPQIDPNGIYGGNTSATFVLCVGSGGQVYLHHAEENAHAVAGNASWDYKLHRIVVTGAPTFKVHTK